MIIAAYDAILDQWECEDFYNHLSNYTNTIYKYYTTNLVWIGPITKINQSDYSIASQIFSQYNWTRCHPERSSTIALEDFLVVLWLTSLKQVGLNIKVVFFLIFSFSSNSLTLLVWSTSDMSIHIASNQNCALFSILCSWHFHVINGPYWEKYQPSVFFVQTSLGLVKTLGRYARCTVLVFG